MSAPTPTGPIAVAVDALRTLISNLTIFQTITSAVDAPSAATRVFYAELGVPIVSVSVSGTTATIVTARPHNLTSTQPVIISGASVGGQGFGLAGETVISSVDSATQFEVLTSAAAGTYRPDFAWVIPGGRPYAIVSEPGEGGLRASTIGTGGASVLSGTLEILLECNVTASYVNVPAYAQTEMRNTAAEFLRQLIQTQGTGDFIVLNSVELVSCEFTTSAEQDDGTNRYERWRAMYRCTWGLEG